MREAQLATFTSVRRYINHMTKSWRLSWGELHGVTTVQTQSKTHRKLNHQSAFALVIPRSVTETTVKSKGWHTSDLGFPSTLAPPWVQIRVGTVQMHCRWSWLKIKQLLVLLWFSTNSWPHVMSKIRISPKIIDDIGRIANLSEAHRIRAAPGRCLPPIT